MNSLNFRPWICSSVVVLALMGCDQAQNNAKAPAGQIPEVGVVTLASQNVSITTELPGRITPFRVADVRPQVGGVILKRLFKEGGEVEAGQQLYQIDPATYEAAYASAKATLAHAEATVKSARAKADRYKALAEANAVGKQDYDDAEAAALEAEADVASGKAAVETARINLVYTKVLSPISGRVGRSSVTEGALVTSGQSTAMATVQQLDPVYVDVTQSSTELLRLRREMAEGRLQKAGDGQPVAKLVLEDGSDYPETGKLLFSEVTVDTSTGMVTLRALFPNPKRMLLPGMFVHARVEEGMNDKGLLVPQQSVSRNQRGEPTALVVGTDNKVETRVLKVDRTIGDNWLVTDGVKPGDRVIVEGIQKIKPGIPVRAVPVGSAQGSQAGAAPSAK